MPNKYYVILYSPQYHTITIPVKAPTNQYNNTTLQFAGGYPAIFGGTVNGTVTQTLRGEVNEESRGTLAMNGQFTEFYAANVGTSVYRFFWSANQWGTTGQQWGAPNNFSEGEMAGWVTISLHNFQAGMTRDQIRDRLIQLTGAPGGNQQQADEFNNSETLTAFVNFITNVALESVAAGALLRSGKRLAQRSHQRAAGTVDAPHGLSQANLLGQAFDVTSSYNVADSVITPLLDPSKAGTREFTFLGTTYTVPAYVLPTENTTAKAVEDTVETREAFQDSISAEVGVQGRYGLFSGEMEAAYGRDFSTSSDYYYSYRTFVSRLAVLDLLPDEAKKVISSSFIDAVERLPDHFGPDTFEAYEDFFYNFGAYYTSRIVLGASLNYYVATAKTSSLTSDQVHAQFKAEYKGVLYSAGVSASITATAEWQSYSSNRTTNITATGGSPALIGKLMSIDPDDAGDATTAAYNAWFDSIAINPAVAEFNLVGIWELIPNEAKAELVAQAFVELQPMMRPQVSIATSSTPGSVPRIVLNSRELTPENPPDGPSGYQVVILGQNQITGEPLLSRCYSVPEGAWYDEYEKMYARIQADITTNGLDTPDNVLILASYGMSTNAPPTSDIVPTLFSAGAGATLQQFIDWADPGSNMKNWLGTYILIGQFGTGKNAGVELLSYDYVDPNGAPSRQDAYFYRQRGFSSFTISEGFSQVGTKPVAQPNDLRRSFAVAGRSQAIARPSQSGE